MGISWFKNHETPMKKAMVYGTFHGLDETIILQSSWLLHGISLTGFSLF